MNNIKEIEINKTYIIDDIISTGLTDILKFKPLIDISKYINNDENYLKNNDKINCFFGQILENKKTNMYIFPFQCLEICKLILYLKTNFKERTDDKIFPFCFYIRKTSNNDILFLPLDKKVRQMLFGLYEHFYGSIPIIKGFLYSFKCKPKKIEIYNTNIPSEKFLFILQNIDENMNCSLNYNCMVCKKKLKIIKQCSKCKWALYCSNICYNNEEFKKHISDELFVKKMEYYNELKISP